MSRYGTFRCQVCGKTVEKKSPTQMVCSDCRRDSGKMRKWNQARAEAETAASLELHGRPPKERSLAAVDRKIKAQGLQYGDWSRAESIVRGHPPAVAIPYDGEPEAAIFRFMDYGGVAAARDPGKTPPAEAEEALTWYIRRVRARIVVYSEGRKIWLVRK